MREYAKLNPAFWAGETGRTLKAVGPHAMLVALYLVASPHSNALGLYYLPKLFIAYETGLSPEAVESALVALEAAGFAGYDEAAEVVFVRDMAGVQVAESLKPGDGRVKWVNDRYAGLPANRFLPEFFDRWGARLCVKYKRDATGARLTPPLAAPAGEGGLCAFKTRAGDLSAQSSPAQAIEPPPAMQHPQTGAQPEGPPRGPHKGPHGGKEEDGEGEPEHDSPKGGGFAAV